VLDDLFEVAKIIASIWIAPIAGFGLESLGARIIFGDTTPVAVYVTDPVAIRYQLFT